MTLHIPQLNNVCPKRGNALTAAFGRFMMRVMGWQIAGNLPAESKLVIAWAPHTSYTDWFVCMACMLAIRLQSSWMAAHGFFWWPLSQVMKGLGGIPINRNGSHNIVAQMIDRFNRQEQLILAISPEGSRQKVRKWKTGFYYIAKGANVPILLMSLDYATRTLTLGPTFTISGNVEADLQQIQSHFKKFRARHPAQG